MNRNWELFLAKGAKEAKADGPKEMAYQRHARPHPVPLPQEREKRFQIWLQGGIADDSIPFAGEAWEMACQGFAGCLRMSLIQ